MNKFKRLTSLVLCVLMLVSCLAVSQVSFAFAATEGDYSYTVNSDGYAVITGYAGTQTVVTIPGTLGEYTVTEIGDDAFEGSAVTEVSVPASVTVIGDTAFKDCAALESISLPAGLLSLGDGAFVDCASLESLEIGNVTYIGISALSGCTALKELTVPFVGNTAGTNGSMATLFDGVGVGGFPASLTKITVTSDATVDAGAFEGMSDVTTIDWKTTPTQIGDTAFKDCEVLAELNLDLVKVSGIGASAFENCKALTSIALPGNIISLGDKTFAGCTALADITATASLQVVGKDALKDSKWYDDQADGAILLGNVFVGWKGTDTKVIVPDTATAIADSVLEGNTAVTSVVIPNSVVYIGVNILKNATALEELTVPYVAYKPGDMETAFIGYFFGGTAFVSNATALPASLKKVAITDLAVVQEKCFNGCQYLETISIPACVTEIKPLGFAGCPALANVEYNAVNAEIADDAFADSGVSKVTFGDTVEVIPTYLCTGNSALTSLNIPEAVTTIQNNAFSGCYNIITVNYNAVNCTSIAADAFEYCHKLQNIVLGEKVEHIPANLYTRYGASQMTQITIPEGITSIAENAFEKCTSLTTLKYNAAACTIGANAFSACSELNNIVIGENVTTIPENLYTANTKITKVEIPSQITHVDDYAFNKCTNLSEVVVPATLKSIGQNTMADTKWYQMQADGPVYLGHIFYGYKGEMPESNATIEIKEGTTAIAGGAFKGNGALESVIVPDSVAFIGENAFEMTSASIICSPAATEVIEYANANGIGVILMSCSCPDTPDRIVYYVITKDATETEKGTWKSYCKLCGLLCEVAEFELADKAGKWILTKEVTCTEDGVISNGTDTINLPKTGHKDTAWKEVKAPSCSEFGIKHEYCLTCGQTTGNTGNIAKTAHDAGDWQNIKPARTYCTGMDGILCTKCGEVLQSRTLPILEEEISLENYSDLLADKWYYPTVEFAVANSLFKGVTDTKFGPNDVMNRAMFVTVLGRLAGVSVDNDTTTKFTDVKSGKYYTGYVAWASENEIVNGMTKTTFAPNRAITREQICTMLVRYCDYSGITLGKVVDEILFRDADKISDYAFESITICQTAGLVKGRGDNYFAPKATATRAEVAQVLMNLALGYLAD